MIPHFSQKSDSLGRSNCVTGLERLELQHQVQQQQLQIQQQQLLLQQQQLELEKQRQDMLLRQQSVPYHYPPPYSATVVDKV